MPQTPTATAVQQAEPDMSARATADVASTGTLVDDDTIVEEISIDGMCGVY